MILRRIGSGSLRGGAGSPEKRVTARSKAAPEEMDRAGLADKARTEDFEHVVTETSVRQKRRAYSLS